MIVDLFVDIFSCKYMFLGVSEGLLGPKEL